MKMKIRMLTSIGGEIEAAYGQEIDVDTETGKRLIASDQAEAVKPAGGRKASRGSADAGSSDQAPHTAGDVPAGDVPAADPPGSNESTEGAPAPAGDQVPAPVEGAAPAAALSKPANPAKGSGRGGSRKSAAKKGK